MSIDPDVASTDQPYIFTNDDPLNAEDPLGQCWGCSFFHAVASGFDDTRHAVAATGNWAAQHPMEVLGGVAIVLGVASGVGIFVAADAIIGASALEATGAAEAADAAIGTERYSASLENSIRTSTELFKTTGEVAAHAASILLGLTAPLIGAGILLLTVKSTPVKKSTPAKSTKK